MRKNNGTRILGKNVTVSNDTFQTMLNNNDLIIGPSGAGKTRNYVKPNMMQCNESMVIMDTKGSLYGEMAPFLREKGYDVRLLDFYNTRKSSCGYNPLRFIRRSTRTGRYHEQDIQRIAKIVVPSVNTTNDPFWDNAARLYFTFALAFVLETSLDKRDRNLKTVMEIAMNIGSSKLTEAVQNLNEEDENSMAVRYFRLLSNNMRAEKTHASILAILGEHFNGLVSDDMVRMYRHPIGIDFKELGKKKTVLFLNTSDTDHCQDKILGLAYTQSMQELIQMADQNISTHRLDMPVRYYLDDFASNLPIPDFDKTISVIRSREISVSIVLQSISQLQSLYTKPQALTIMNNCDNWIYLGGQDLETAELIGNKANRPKHEILNMPLNKVYLFTRGQQCRFVDKYNICDHPLYRDLPEAEFMNGTEVVPA